MGASFEEVVTGAESLRPVLLLKAVVNSVTFRLIIITIIIIILIIIVIIIIIIIFTNIIIMSRTLTYIKSFLTEVVIFVQIDHQMELSSQSQLSNEPRTL